MNNVKPFSELSPGAQRIIRSDPHQPSLLGTKHEYELQHLQKKRKPKKEVWQVRKRMTPVHAADVRVGGAPAAHEWQGDEHGFW